MDGYVGHDRQGFAHAAQSLRKAVPQMQTGQDTYRQSMENETAKSVGTNRRADQDAASSEQNTKRKYFYCIDTSQITNVIDYAIQMMGVSMKEIEK